MSYNKKLYRSVDSVIDSSTIYDDTQSKLQSEINTELSSEINNKDLIFHIAAFSSLPKTITNNAITSDHVLSEATLGTPFVQEGDWIVTTADGSVTISGNISGSTTLDLVLTKASSYSVS